MTNRPRRRTGGPVLPGVLAVALFVAMALVVIATPFGDATGFPDGISITAEIGYALLDLSVLQSSEGSMPQTESFLAAFILVAIVLDAALDASLLLARREEEGETVTAIARTDGGSDSGGDGE